MTQIVNNTAPFAASELVAAMVALNLSITRNSMGAVVISPGSIAAFLQSAAAGTGPFAASAVSAPTTAPATLTPAMVKCPTCDVLQAAVCPICNPGTSAATVSSATPAVVPGSVTPTTAAPTTPSATTTALTTAPITPVTLVAPVTSVSVTPAITVPTISVPAVIAAPIVSAPAASAAPVTLAIVASAPAAVATPDAPSSSTAGASTAPSVFISSGSGNSWYAVIVGREVGVFEGSHHISHLVTGVSCGSCKGFKSREQALRFFNDAVDKNSVEIAN